MEQGPNVRRRSRDGGVTVDELLTRQPRFRRSIRDEIPEASSLSQSPLAARVTTGVIGGLLLLASASAVSAIIALPSSDPRPAFPQHVGLAGEQALRLDLIERARWPFAPSDAVNTPGDHQPAPHPQTPVRSPANPSAGSTGSALTLVENYYRLLGSDSHQAASLMSPTLLRQDEAAAVARSWEGVTSVRPGRIEVQQDGSVVADVSVAKANGAWLGLRHRFEVELGAAPRITSATLVAATYSPPR